MSYLVENENPNAKLRSNGKRGQYYPTRSKQIQGIVVHTAEGGKKAVNIAKYLSTTPRTASAHVVIDDNVIVELVPDDFTAFHCRGSNSKSLGLEIAYFAAKWGEDPVFEEAVIALSASWCAQKAEMYNIPMERVTIDEWNAGKKGFISHAECDPGRRTDPGKNFDWDKFFSYMKGMSVDDYDTEFEEVEKPKKVNCTGVNLRGNACKRRCVPGESFCERHDPSLPPKEVKNKKKNKKVVPEHNHGIGEVPSVPCKLCDTHGDIFDMGVTDVVWVETSLS